MDKAKLTQVLLFMHCLSLVTSDKLLFFLVDGFRWDYFDLPGLQLTGFSRLFHEGTRAEWMVPDFPTNSFPNYKTLETGLHVENHGVVGNYMFDPRHDRHFELPMEYESTYHPDWWDKVESFFITGERQGIRSGLFQVRGCDILINGVLPTYCLPYADPGPTKQSTTDALHDAIHMMKQGKIDIAYIYHQNVDAMGHYHGPNSDQVKAAVQDVDGHINDVLDEIDELGLDDVNIMVVSDHGMTSIDQLHKINITKVLNMDDIRVVTEGGTQTYIWSMEGREAQVYESLKSFHKHLHVYYRQEIMERWFFKSHSLIPPIFLTADKGWYIVHPMSEDRYFESMDSVWQGNHGFDNDDLDMRSIFVAKGPEFKKNHVIRGFNNVNVYQMICHVTGITPNEHNGTWSVIQDAFIVCRDCHIHNDL